MISFWSSSYRCKDTVQLLLKHILVKVTNVQAVLCWGRRWGRGCCDLYGLNIYD